MKDKPLKRLTQTEQWCDYELLSVVAGLMIEDGRSVHVPLKDFGSIMIITPAGGFTSLNDLAALMLYIADYLENIENYK